MQRLYREYSIALNAPAYQWQMLRGIEREHTEHGFRAVHPSRPVRLQQVPPVIAAEYNVSEDADVLDEVIFVRI